MQQRSCDIHSPCFAAPPGLTVPPPPRAREREEAGEPLFSSVLGSAKGCRCGVRIGRRRPAVWAEARRLDSPLEAKGKTACCSHAMEQTAPPRGRRWAGKSLVGIRPGVGPGWRTQSTHRGGGRTRAEGEVDPRCTSKHQLATLCLGVPSVNGTHGVRSAPAPLRLHELFGGTALYFPPVRSALPARMRADIGTAKMRLQ